MSKQQFVRRAGGLLLVVAGLVALLRTAQPATGGQPHLAYLPLALNNDPLYLYDLQPGSPTYLANFLNTSGCNWLGIVGRAFGLDNNPVVNLTVHLEGGGLNVDVVTGSGPSALGPGGYQIPIADHPIATTDTYHLQLRTNTYIPLSEVFVIPTYAACAKNTVMVNFSARR